jgi:hypothetical protein
MGTSDNPVEIENYCQQGKKWIENQLGRRDIFTEYARMKEEQQTLNFCCPMLRIYCLMAHS